MSSPLVVIAVIQANPEKVTQLYELLKSLVPITYQEEGCIRYELNVSEDGLTFIFTEQWTSKPLWDAHMETPHLENFKSRADELVADFKLHVMALDPVNPPA